MLKKKKTTYNKSILFLPMLKPQYKKPKEHFLANALRKKIKFEFKNKK